MNKMKVFVFGFLTLGFLASHVSTFSNGLVYKACDTMMPEHGASAQTTEPTYSVSASSHSCSPAEEITVTLQANPGTYFKGFLLQAHGVPGNKIVGHFIVTDRKSQNLACGENVDSTLTHTDSSKKTIISVLWVVPASVSSVIFTATFLQSKRVFWMGVQSPQLTVFQAAFSMVYAIGNDLLGALQIQTRTTKVPSVSCVSNPNSNTTSSPTALSNTSSTSSSTPPPFLSSSHPPPPPYISSETCGTQKICFSSPSDCDPSKSSNCFFMSSAMTDDDAYHFEISGPSGGYVSIGFSDDQLMGQDDVYICVINSNGQVEIQHAYTEGRKSPLILPLGNVNVRMTSFTSGLIQCSFTSRNQISTQLPTHQDQSSSSSDNYYILFAYGPADKGRIQFHGRGVFSSDTKVNLTETSNVTHKEHSKHIMVKTHGALMLIAWMTTGSLGMIIARYFKAVKTLILGKALWFQAHLVFMVLTVAATIVSFVLSFVEGKGWAYDVSIHAILGCIVMILAFFQPLIAFFRPSPQSSQRYIFNWIHGVNALVMKVLAVANLFLGFQFIDYRLGWMVKVMGGFVGWEALAVIFLEINAGLARKEMNKFADKQSNKPLVKYEVYLLLIYLCGNLTFLIALLVGIGQS